MELCHYSVPPWKRVIFPCLYFRFPEYVFITDKASVQSANTKRHRHRYTDKGLRNIILDIHFLSLTNYLVCTFSSNVRRDALVLHIMSKILKDA